MGKKPVSVRAYLRCLVDVGTLLHRERADHRRHGVDHPFDGFPLDRLGTHSFKRTAVVLMKDVALSTALVGSIAGTSAKTLERIYDTPTRRRQVKLVSKAFDPMATALGIETTSATTGASLPASAASTRKRQRCSSEHATPSVGIGEDPSSEKTTKKKTSAMASTSSASFCSDCGQRREATAWRHCPFCGHLY